MLLPAYSAAFLLLSPNAPQPDSCLAQSYFGIYGQQHLVISPDGACVGQSIQNDQQFHVIRPSQNVEQLVWLQHQAVDGSIDSGADVDTALSSIPFATLSQDQVILGNQRPYELLHRTGDSALVSVDAQTALSLDLHLPRAWKASPLPTEPVSFIPVPPKAVDRVKDILTGIKFDPDVAAIVNNISIEQLRADVRYLTGESPSSEIVSRHSFSQGVHIAAKWLKNNFEAHGATCELENFLSGFAPNVIW